jgi:hypothetical protein
MTLYGIAVALTITVAAVSTHAAEPFTSDFVFKVQETDLELLLLREGFSASAIDDIRGVAIFRSGHEICGVDYVSSLAAAQATVVMARKHDIPPKMMLEKSSVWAEIISAQARANTRFALNMCRMHKVVKQERDK